MQFGEGNFLRAFVDYWFDLANEKAGWNGKCCLIQPIAQGLSNMIDEQEGLYTLYLRGSENGQKVDAKRVISSVSRCLNPYEKAGYEAIDGRLQQAMTLRSLFPIQQKQASSMIRPAKKMTAHHPVSRQN